MLAILSRCGGPTGIRAAGRRRLASIATAHAPRIGDKLVTAILAALDEQTVTAPGTTPAVTVLPRLADSLKTVLQQRKQVAAEAEEILDAHPLAGVLTSMPGIGVRTAALIYLARRRCDVLFAMLRTKRHYRLPQAATTPAAA